MSGEMHIHGINIPISRFEELVRKETRLDVITDKLINGRYIENEELLRIIGSETAVKKADEIKAENDMKRNEYLDRSNRLE